MGIAGGLRSDWRFVLAAVSGGHFLSHFYFLALPPLFPLLRAEFGLTNVELGLLVSVASAGGLLQAPVGGIVDRIGAERVFVAGVAVTAAGIAMIGLGPTYPALVALSVVTGIGQSAFHPADYSLIDAVAEPDVRGRAFSVHTFSGFAGFAAAPLAVGILAATTGWRVALYVIGAAGLVYAALAAVALLPGERVATGGGTAAEAGTDSLAAAVRRPGILAMIGFFVLTAFAAKGVQTFTPVLAVDALGLAEADGNALLSAYFVLGSVGVLAGGVLADRYAPGRVIAATLTVGAAFLGLVGIGAVPTGSLPLLALFGVIGFFLSLVTPARDRLVSELAASGSAGRSFGVVFTGGTAGVLVGPVILGAIGDATTISVSFVAIAAVYVAAGVLAFSLGRGWLGATLPPAPAEAD